MGVDIRVKLPGNVRLRDVASIIGAVAGCPTSKSYFNDRCDENNGWSTKVEGVMVSGCHSPSLASIDIKHQTMIDGESRHYVLFHFESDGGEGRLMLPPSTPFWMAVMTRVVDFFGGELDYNDCDKIDCDYKVKAKSNKQNCPSDGKEWYDLQERILALEPITKEEWLSYNDKSAYPIKEMVG